MRLGINTGFAVNRYPLPEQWMKVIEEDLDLRYVQLTADLINPCWSSEILEDLIERIKECKIKYNISIESLMTGAFTRVNHFSHPDKKIRRYWMDWFKKLAETAVRLGASNVSSHLGILCYEDMNNPTRKEYILKETISAWKYLAEYGKEIGLKSLSWEPMSIKREYGETIEETMSIQKLLEGSAIPIYLCLDVDHGDITSKNPDDFDYKKWLANFASRSPFIHVKQSLPDKGGHYPFIEEYNIKGCVSAKEVISTLKENGAKDPLLLLELSFREREPTDTLVLQYLKESVDYWKREMK
jgi:sugar phosphate isomerase/epimerase